MSFDLEGVAERLATSGLENAGDLPAVDADRVRAMVTRLAASGRRARVVALLRGTPLESWHALFGRAGLDPKRDLLLLWNGQRMEARGWGLDRRVIHDALAAQQQLIAERPGDAIGNALVHLSSAAGSSATSNAAPDTGEPAAAAGERGATGDSSSGSISSLALLGGAGALVLGLAGGVAFIVRRRQRRAAESSAAFAEALAAADSCYAELMLAAEDLEGADGRQLQLRAGTLKQRLDVLASDVRKQPVLGTNPVTLGKVRQLENEIAALRSTALQKRRS